MAKPRILLSFLVDEQTESNQFGQLLLNLMFHIKELSPEFVGNSEPIENPVDSINDAIIYWSENPFMWRRRHRIISSGYVHHTGVYGAGSVILDATYNASFEWCDLFHNLVSLTNPSYAYLHLVTEHERASTELGVAEMQQFSLGALAKTVNQGFIELGWANYFGEKWRDSIDMQRLTESSSKIIVSDRGILFKITENLEDINSDYAAFAARRRVVKSAFSPGVFR